MEKFGIDVAKWQGTIDWAKVKKSGVEFAILKVTKKGNGVEELFEKNYAGAIANELKVGVYRYVYATTVAQAQQEANAIVNTLKGKNITCGVWLDMEDTSIKGLGKSVLTSIIRAESSILTEAGYKVGIYCNKDWYNNVLDSATLKKDYPFWIARYPSNDTGAYNAKSSLSPKSYACAWQYSSKGKVDGISGNVDMDVSFVDLQDLMYLDTDIYYPKYTGTTVSIVTALKAVGETDTSLTHRKKIATANSISGYTGTAAQNTKMLTLLKSGKLVKA